MISFIVIGRNEGQYLEKCFQSIIISIEQNNISNYEIIYIDSNSEDESIHIALKYPQIKIYQLTLDFNAAIARNIGAKESKGDILFFIDGDMEIVSGFIPLVYQESKGLSYPFISGKFINSYYSFDGKFITIDAFKPNKRDSIESVTGGLFLIDRKLWYSVDGMDNKFKISQDIDFALRLRRKGIPLLRKKEILAIHHTVSYLQNSRMWKDLFKGNSLYSKSLLYRKHIMNMHVYKRLFRNDYTLAFLFAIIPLAYIFNLYGLLFVYLLLIMSKACYLRKGLNSQVLKYFLYYMLRDIINLIGFVGFWPKKPNNVKYMRVNK